MTDLSNEITGEIRRIFKERDEDFAARQELIIQKTITEQLRVAEETRRSRLQFITALGGFSLVSLALLAWGNISDLVQNRTETVISENLAGLELIKADFEAQRKLVDEQSRLAIALRNNTEASLREFEDTLSSVKETLGEIQTAKGGSKLTETIVQFHNQMDRLEARLETLARSGTQPPTSGATIGECVNDDGTFNSDC